MMRPVRCLPLFILLACVFGLSDVPAKDRFGVGVKAGTYGFGAEVGYSIIDRVGIRGSLTGGSPSFSEEVDDIDYDVETTLGGVGVLADIYPLAGQFRVSAGLFSNQNEIDLSARPTGPVEIGDMLYPPATVGTLSGKVTFDNTAPYVGIGWGNVSRGKSRLRLMIDLGVLLQGSPQVENLRASSGLVAQDDLDREARRIEEDLEEFDFWPVISFGLGIRID